MEKQRMEELIREERELLAALRPLRGAERVGELDWSEEQRKEQLRARLAEVRAEGLEIKAEQDRRRRERDAAAREAREEEERQLKELRSKVDRENALINRVVTERRRRCFEVGLGGISAGGQPKGSAATVNLSRKIEREIALLFDVRAEEVFGYPARYIRNLADDDYFGVHLDHNSGEIEAGPPGAPEPPVRSPVEQPHTDWSGPSVPYHD